MIKPRSLDNRAINCIEEVRMDQPLTFADSELSNKRRRARREKFLSRMDGLIPWARLATVIESHYPKAGNGRCPSPLSTMFRIHCMQQWYNLSDPTIEDALYEIASMRLGIDLSLDKAIQDHSSNLRTHHLLERYGLTRQSFVEVYQWHFGMKLISAWMRALASYIASPPHRLMSTISIRRCSCCMVKRRMPAIVVQKSAPSSELKNIRADGYIAEQPGRLETLIKHSRINKVRIRIEYLKSSIRAKVEHPFRIIKCQFSFVKARYRGLKKNDGKLANLVHVDQILRA